MAPRQWFERCTEGFVEIVGEITDDQLDAVGLGAWDVRSLLGHTTRAFLTIETYLGHGAAVGQAPDEVVLATSADYFRAALQGLADPAQVTQRGRDAGAALGPDPTGSARAIAARVGVLVAATDDGARVRTPVGGMRMVDYLPSRALEITIHSVDLAAAVGRDVPETLVGCIPDAAGLALEVGTPAQRLTVLRAITGRGSLPPAFSLL